MKRVLTLIFCSLALIQLSARGRISLNEGWSFKKGDPTEMGDTLRYQRIKSWVLPSGNKFIKNGLKYQDPKEKLDGGDYTKKSYDDSGWRKLNIPHDWGIEGDFKQELPGETAKLEWFGVAWYRKQIDIPAEDAGKLFFLEIDGAMSYSTVWCNGEFVGGWPYGYASYKLDLSPYIKVGEKNQIAIRLDNPDLSSRWYPGGGIYRNVWLLKTRPVHVDQWGTFVTSEIEGTNAKVNALVEIVNSKNTPVEIELKNTIQEPTNNPSTKNKVIQISSNYTLEPGINKIEMPFNIKDFLAWDLETPFLYKLTTEIREKSVLVDIYETNFGIRSIEFTADDGFHLNGKRVRLQGVCMHHDHGALGSAFNYRAMERQIEILQEMGANAIRTSHNPPAPEMLDLCDKMGMLVIDEFVDTWTYDKKPNGYSKIFHDWHEQDLRAFIRRDRNHPSVIAWSTGNEVDEQHNKTGIVISRLLTSIVHDEDKTRPVTIGNNNPNSGFNGFAMSTDVFGYNYKPHLYIKFREANPHIPLYGSETSSCISTRGEYLFPVSNDKSQGKIGVHISSYDLYAPGWASSPDVEFKGQDEEPSNAGEFVWTGFDYLGEPTPFTGDMTVLTNYNDPKEKAAAEKTLKEMGKITVPSRSSYFGIVDLAGFKKDRFYIYQARWKENFPMAHILPHWNWAERAGEITPIHVYTSGDEAELFLNGKSLGKKKKGQYEYRLRWDDVVYEAGEVKVVAYKNGKIWAEDVVKTTGKATQLGISADRKQMKNDAYDLIYVTVKVEDKTGLTVPRSHNLIDFTVSGPAKIVATDNGDPTSHQSFQNTYVKAFNGLALVILKAEKGKTGTVTLSAKSKGLKGNNIKVQVNK